MKNQIAKILLLVGVGLGLIAIFIFYDNPLKQNNISGIVVPHHDLVAAQRTKLFEELSKQVGDREKPETIILVSPNHYFTGQGRIQTSDQIWKLKQGQIEPNAGLISKLLDSGLVSKEPTTFNDEHGIYSIFGDIKKIFPDARLVPLVLKEPSVSELDQLSKLLYESCENCLMISSVDFSHYQPAILAELHDEKSIRDLSLLNTTNLYRDVEADSGPSLALLTLWAKLHSTLNFKLVDHTNSSLLLNNPDVEGTSHIFGWFQSEDVEPVDSSKTFVISNRSSFGVENRTIWGTDFSFKEPLPGFDTKNMIIAGRIAEQYIEFFGLPVDPKNPNKLATGEAKNEALVIFYNPYKNYLVSDPTGNYIKIPLPESINPNQLSKDSMRDIIKSIINKNNDI